MRGLGAAELRLCTEAYELSARLFAGRYRATGKPFVCHLVGTASLLLPESPPVHVIAAALLHAAYLPIISPTGKREVTRKIREDLRRVSPAAEALIAGFTELPTNPKELSALSVRVSPPTQTGDQNAVAESTRWTWLMRVADALEDYLDGGAHESGKELPPLSAVQQLAEQLDARSLANVAKELLAAEVLLVTRGAGQRPPHPSRVTSFTVHPSLRVRIQRAVRTRWPKL